MTWRETILDVLAQCPWHIWSVDQICTMVRRRPIVTERLLECSYGQPDYRHYTRSELARRVKAGDVLRLGRDQYRLN